MLELLALFLASFAAATLVPLSSEAALWAYLLLNPDEAALAVAVATTGNSAGGMTTYTLGRLLPARQRPSDRALVWLRRYGAPATFFAWLPALGEALCMAAGWLRIRWWAALAFMTAGRLLRYIALVYLTR
jgi:membrane protein YqaA with SNARE-associated domain